MSFLVIWLVLAMIVGVAANIRGRNPVGWTLLAAVISPLIAGLLVLALPHHVETEQAVDDEALRQNINRAQAVGSQRGIGFGGWAVVAACQGILRYRRFSYNRLSWRTPDYRSSVTRFAIVPSCSSASDGNFQLVNSRYGAPSLAASPE
jgi:hypothetical protein